MSRKNVWRYVLVSVTLVGIFIGVGESSTEDMVARGDALWKQRDTVEKVRDAIAAWESAAKLKRDPDLWVKIGVAYYQIGEMIPANDNKAKLEVSIKGLDAVQQALNLNPENICRQDRLAS